MSDDEKKKKKKEKGLLAEWARKGYLGSKRQIAQSFTDAGKKSLYEKD